LYKKHSEVFGDDFEEPIRRVPEISKIFKAISWQPKKSLDEIIIEISEYIKSHET
jgi:UDP-glucose 4-epimerase